MKSSVVRAAQEAPGPSARPQPQPSPAAGQPARRRLSTEERERQILTEAIRFFARRGLDGQLRDLAKEIGITHTLLYHYFPTKQALIERVYLEVFEGRWKSEWEDILDAKDLGPQEKLNRFYCDYAAAVLTYDFVRILVFSGLSDRTITDRYFALLRDRLFPRLVRETRRHCGVKSRGKPTPRELELLMGLHGGIFYFGIRRWIYGQGVYSEAVPQPDEVFIRDRVHSYLISAREVLMTKPSDEPHARPSAPTRIT